MNGVKARCVMCSNERVIAAGEVPRDDMPVCDKCYGPMVAVSAKATPKSSKLVGVGTAVERLDPTSASHRMRGEVIEADGEHLTVRWSSGRSTKVARSAEGKRWRRAG